MRGKSIIFESLCFMEWIIGVKEFEIFLRIIRGCEGAWSIRICCNCCERSCHVLLVLRNLPSRISLRH